MKLIAEAGGTKIDWVIQGGNEQLFFKTSGYNPLSSDSNLLRQMLISSFPAEINVNAIQQIQYFGTGCASTIGKDRVYNALNHFFTSVIEIKVYSDLEAVGHALLGNGNKGIVGILGTGASVAFYNGETIEMPVPSLGYLLGDEGSGAYFGKTLLAKILRKELDIEIVHDFYKFFKLNEDQIIPMVYQSKKAASLLASYAAFLTGHQKNEGIAEIVNTGLNLFIEKHLNPIIKIYGNLPIAIVGSVAYGLEQGLLYKIKNVSTAKVIIQKSPLKGLLSK